MYLKCLVCGSVIIGAIFLVISIRLSLKIKQFVPTELSQKWKFIILMMIFFLVGYISIVIILALNIDFSPLPIAGAVFFGGAVFVYLIINISNVTIQKTVEKARIEHELYTAKAIQAALLPQSDPLILNLDVSGFYKSASETGGDWYGFIYDKNKTHILIGDVTGHGVPAALVTAAVKGTCSSIQQNIDKRYSNNLQATDILQELNTTVFYTGQQKFVMTFFVASFHHSSGKLEFSNAGHNFPWYYQNKCEQKNQDNDFNKKNIRTLACRGYRLGFAEELEFNIKSVYLCPGDIIIFYTDGLTEGENSAGQQLGKRKIKTIIKKNTHLCAKEIKNKIIEFAFNFFGECQLVDDITLLIVKVKDEAKFESSD